MGGQHGEHPTVLELKEVLTNVLLHFERETETPREESDCPRPPRVMGPGTDQKAKTRWTSRGPLPSFFTVLGV